MYLASLEDILSLTPPPESYDAHDPDVVRCYTCLIPQGRL